MRGLGARAPLCATQSVRRVTPTISWRPWPQRPTPRDTRKGVAKKPGADSRHNLNRLVALSRLAMRRGIYGTDARTRSIVSWSMSAVTMPTRSEESAITVPQGSAMRGVRRRWCVAAGESFTPLERQRRRSTAIRSRARARARASDRDPCGSVNAAGAHDHDLRSAVDRASGRARKAKVVTNGQPRP